MSNLPSQNFSQPGTVKTRNQAIDFIRMFALFGICIVNVPFLAMSETSALATPNSGADLAVKLIFETLLQMKFFLLFSFAFGWGMGVQQRSAERKGKHFGHAWRKRLFILALLGIAHGILVFEGDILLIYALFGMLLYKARHWQNSTLKVAALSLVGLSTCLFAGLILLEDMASESANKSAAAQHLTGMAGSYIDAVTARLQIWPETFVFLTFLQGPLVLASFFAGLMASRNNLMDKSAESFQQLNALLPVLLVVGFVWSVVAALANSEMLPAQWDPEGLLSFLALFLMPLSGSALALAYLVGIIRLAHSPVVLAQFERNAVLNLLLLAGRNTLSGYLLQGILAGLVFGGYGLRWYEQFGYAALLPISEMIALVSMLLVGVWAKRFGTGPFEVLLRK